MKAYLLHDGKDFDWRREEFWNERTLVQDLELNTLYKVMAAGDEYLFDIAKEVPPVSLPDLDEILYRQAVLRDCIAHEDVAKQIYAIAVEAIAAERKSFYWGVTSSPTGILHGARGLVQTFSGVLGRLRRLADDNAGHFESPGFRRFFDILWEDLTDEHFVTITRCLKEIRFSGGVLISARPGRGNKGEHYVLRKPHEKDPNFFRRMFAKRPPSRTFRFADRDENGARALGELEARGLNHVANALAQFADHIKSFFSMLSLELGFYLGCLNLRSEPVRRGVPVCFPVPHTVGERSHRYQGLYDVATDPRISQSLRRRPGSCEQSRFTNTVAPKCFVASRSACRSRGQVKCWCASSGRHQLHGCSYAAGQVPRFAHLPGTGSVHARLGGSGRGGRGRRGRHVVSRRRARRVVHSCGAYADYAIVPAAGLAKLPETITYDIAAAAIFQGSTAH